MIYVLIAVLAVAVLVLLCLVIDLYRRADHLDKARHNHAITLTEHARRIRAVETKLSNLETWARDDVPHEFAKPDGRTSADTSRG